jgi:hypothetical protein
LPTLYYLRGKDAFSFDRPRLQTLRTEEGDEFSSALADISGGRHPDLMTEASVFEGQGGGRFSPEGIPFSPLSEPRRIVDVDGDGDLDLLYRSYVTLWDSSRPIVTRPSPNWQYGSAPWAADINANGLPDLVHVSESGVGLFLGQSTSAPVSGLRIASGRHLLLSGVVPEHKDRFDAAVISGTWPDRLVSFDGRLWHPGIQFLFENLLIKPDQPFTMELPNRYPSDTTIGLNLLIRRHSDGEIEWIREVP